MLVARSTVFTPRLCRVFAAASGALVFALTIFAVSPIAHQWLHVEGAPHSEDGCAVVLFANGVSLPIEQIHVGPPAEIGQRLSPATAAEVVLISPRYLHQPERGPPVCPIA